MPSDTDDKARKSTQRYSRLPSELVCTAKGAATTKNGVELSFVLCSVVVLMYMFGVYESAASLPQLGTSNQMRELGRNLNLARLHDATEHARALKEEKEFLEREAQMEPADGAEDQEEEDVDPDLEDIQLNEKVEKFDEVEGDLDVEEIPANQDENEGVEMEELEEDTLSDPEIPEGVWPVSLQDEPDENFEELMHTGDEKTVLTVPKFWAPPLHNGKQFEREAAMKIGTCAEPDPVTGSNARGDDCPPDQRTIFIAIASYRDFQCRLTVESAFKRAKNPDRVRIGIVDQIVGGEDPVCDEPVKPCEEDQEQAQCKYAKQIDVYKMEARLSIGPVFARHIGYRMYRGEYYSTQSDAHVTFVVNWDEDIVGQMEATHNEMAVLSTYLSDVQGSIDEDGNSLRNTRPIMCNTVFEGGDHLRHLSQPEMVPPIHGTPQLAPWWAAGYSFSRGHFIVNVPYDPYQPMIFQGEEMSIGIRGFSVGYDFYAPERSVCFHHYATGKNKRLRNKVKNFWENGSLYAGAEGRSMNRLLGIVHMNPEVDPKLWDHSEERRYGLGGVRTPEQFYEIYGIDVHQKKTQGHLCMLVQGGQLHREFTPKLRSDGMGINYSKITFKWLDPKNGGVATNGGDE